MPRVTITVPNKTPQPYRFQLDRISVTLGRGSENDITIDSGSVSVRHAEMRRVEGGYELRDLGSTNGIKVNGERSEIVALRNGISITLGDVAFDFLLSEEELETLASEQPRMAPPPAAPQESESTAPNLPPSQDEPPLAESLTVAEMAGQGGRHLGTILLLILLAVAAFFGGMAIHFQLDTGDSLIHAIKLKNAIVIPVKELPNSSTTLDATPPPAPPEPAPATP